MAWKPSKEHNNAIRRWVAAKGWEVTRTNNNLRRETFAWRNDVRGTPSPTLRICRKVLEDYPAFIVLHHLDELKVAQAIRAQPEARLVVVQNGQRVTLEEG
jgi:hypothetical protein